MDNDWVVAWFYFQWPDEIHMGREMAYHLAFDQAKRHNEVFLYAHYWVTKRSIHTKLIY
jgi:hypothetical protein